jgi:IPT/TIG domain
VTISGSGFHGPADAGAMQATICGVQCANVTVADSQTLVCSSGEYPVDTSAADMHRVLPVAPGQVTATGTAQEQAAYNVAHLFDGDIATTWRCAHTPRCSVSCARRHGGMATSSIAERYIQHSSARMQAMAQQPLRAAEHP